jgi:hypothetical protein
VDFIGEPGKLRLEILATFSTETNSLVGRPLIKNSFVIPRPDKWHKSKKNITAVAVPLEPGTQAAEEAAQPTSEASKAKPSPDGKDDGK